MSSFWVQESECTVFITLVSFVLLPVSRLVMMGLPTRLARAPSLLLARSQTTSATPDPALPFSAIPLAPGAWPILGHLPFMANKKTQARMHIAIENLRKESGDIFKLSIPGETDSVIIFNPDDINTMYSNDGKVPHIIGFEVFEHLRHVMKDRYTTKGLLSNGEDWYTVRHQYQQDMMRPKSALFYINDMGELAEELVTKISGDMGASGSGIPDIHPLMQAYALEAVGCIFLGSKLGTIRGEGDGKRLIDIAEEMLPIARNLTFLPKQLRPLMPSFKRVISLQEEMFDTSKKHVDAAISRITDDDESVIAKLVRACGPGSPVPLIMGIDALQAGIDTTGTSAAVLLYHLADNPDKQDILYQEICDTIGPQGKVTESSLGKMRYLKACQMESQRILPVVFGSSRRTAVR